MSAVRHISFDERYARAKELRDEAPAVFGHPSALGEIDPCPCDGCRPAVYVIDADTPDAVETTFADFERANEDLDGETLGEIGALSVGEQLTFGGGASPVWTIRRVS